MDQLYLDRLSYALDIDITALAHRMDGEGLLRVLPDNTTVIGAHALFDRSGLYADVKTYIVDWKLPKGGRIVDFTCQFAKSFQSIEYTAVRLVCVVIGADGAVRMRVPLSLQRKNASGLFGATMSAEVHAGDRLGVTTTSAALGFAWGNSWRLTDYTHFSYFFSKEAFLDAAFDEKQFAHEIARPCFSYKVALVDQAVLHLTV